jgi:hypothetical protein
MQKTSFFSFFSDNLPTGTSSSVQKFKFFAKIFCKNFLQALFQSAQHIFEKREGSEAGSGSIPLTNGSGRSKNMRIRFRIRIPNTAQQYFCPANISHVSRLCIFLLFPPPYCIVPLICAPKRHTAQPKFPLKLLMVEICLCAV